MTIFLFLTAFIIFVLSCYFFKSGTHPAVLFSGVWTVIFFLYALQLFETIPLTRQMANILFLMVVCFSAGSVAYWLYGKKLLSFFKRKELSEASFKVEYSLRTKLFLALSFVTIIVMFKDEMSIIEKLLRGASYKDITHDAGGQKTVEIKGLAQGFVYMFAVYPMRTIVSPVCAVEFFSRKDNKKYLFLIINAVIVFLNVAHHGGRDPLIVMVASYVVTYSLIRNKITISTAMKKGLLIALLSAASIIMFLSISRGISDVYLSFYAYLICSIPLGQNFLSDPFVSSHYTFGFSSFLGVKPLFMILDIFGIQSPEKYLDAMTIREDIIGTYYPIGDYNVTSMNSCISPGAIAYIDGGYIGEVIIMFLYGFVCTWLFSKQKGAFSKKYVAVYVTFAYRLITSFGGFAFTTNIYLVGAVYMLTFIYSRKNKS